MARHLELQGNAVRIVLRVTRADSKLAGQFISIDQGAQTIP